MATGKGGRVDRAGAWFEPMAGLAGLDAAARTQLAAIPPRPVPRGTVVFRAGDEARDFFIVLAGRIAVTITAPTGREILLYEVAGGETCVQTTVALLGDRRYEGEARVTEDAEAIVIPRPAFDRLMAESPPFRAFVFASFGRRLSDVIHLLEKVAFLPVESRLAAMLLLRAGSGATVAATHQELAAAIGSAREVVSRRLDLLQDRGLVGLARGQVTIRDRRRLEAIAAHGDDVTDSRPG